MAELVEIIGITHNPFLAQMLKADDGADETHQKDIHLG